VVTYQGISVQVQVEDTCEGCTTPYPTNSVDLSPIAFSVLADESVGRLTGVSWSFVDCTSGSVADQTATEGGVTLSLPLVIGIAVGVPLVVVGIIVIIVVVVKRKRTEEHI